LNPELERAIEMVEASGRIVCEVEDAAEMIRPKDKDADLRSAWKQILSVLTSALASHGQMLIRQPKRWRTPANPSLLSSFSRPMGKRSESARRTLSWLIAIDSTLPRWQMLAEPQTAPASPMT
jgi:hypothetical protein